MMDEKRIVTEVGETYIIDALQEECAELIQALNKLKRAKRHLIDRHLDLQVCREHVVEEVGDVMCMLRVFRLGVLNEREFLSSTDSSIAKYNRFIDRINSGGLT